MKDERTRSGSLRVRRSPRAPAVLVTGVLALLLAPAILRAQTEPEAPRTPDKLYNGFQISLYGAAAYTHFLGSYSGPENANFTGNASSWGYAYGAWVNIPLFSSDAALYLRAGWRPSTTDWYSSRTDSLHSHPGVGDILSELTIEYNLFRVDALFRLIGRMDGERIYVGPSFGFVQRKHTRIVDIELDGEAETVIEDGELAVDQNVRVSIIIGLEYAFYIAHNLYLIPAVEVDYPFEKMINDTAPKPDFELRPVFYSVQMSLAYHLF